MRRLAACLAMVALSAHAMDGRQLVDASQRRHAPPLHAYEEWTLVMSDAQGRFSIRTLQHVTEQETHRLVVVTPVDLRGTTLTVGKLADGDAAASPLFGSNFLLSDVFSGQPREQDYRLVGEQLLSHQPHHVIETRPPGQPHPGRRLYLRQDNLFLSRIDYLDDSGQPLRRQSFRDPRADERGIWRPGMILMESLRDGSRTLIKVDRRMHAPEAFAP